ncbi:MULTISPECIES: hypothetical protein [unclassified Bacillus (in: firmicutes)]|uniref:hypothetical protein n=1 Tax=unclassified Bacillus (in: firmicutes) TaxID=185979 RepID=UPI000BF93B9F|nr:MULTISPECIES: hypothetical protein [unclassified Bacillus (in: firmicutes)]PEU18106.1 hypothetical protein CN525_12875 [Bacillus sp. AFS014408]PFW62375.1 hypothetical protein COL20_13085 [Bacillus sp. AFS075034]
MKIKRKALLFCTSILLALPTVTCAKNNDVPFFNGNEDTFLKSVDLQMPGKYYRPGSGYTPPGQGEPGSLYYTADIHYPAVYNGSFNWGNPWENLVQEADGSEPYIRISNEGYINSDVIKGDRLVTEIERMNDSIIANKYWGNPKFVLDNMNKHIIRNDLTNQSYGQFYWIRDVAYLSGGYAGAGGVEGVNRYSLWYVRTSKPEIKGFKASSGAKDQPVTFNFDGFEYVSKEKGYKDRDFADNTVNPYQSIAGERNRVKWTLDITKDGENVNHQEDYIRSKTQKDGDKPNEADPGYFSKDSIRWQPQMCGRYTAKLKVVDGVQRTSNEKIVNFNVDGKCDSKVPPNPDERPYRYNIDLSADRIEGTTAKKGTKIQTRVDVSRASYKKERDEFREIFKGNIKKYQQEVDALTPEYENAEASLRVCRRDPIRVIDAEGNEHLKDRDCTWDEENLDRIKSKLEKAKEKLKEYKGKLNRLQEEEEKYSIVETMVVLRHNGKKVAEQKVVLTEEMRKTLYFDWTYLGKGKLEAEINPPGDRLLDIPEVTYDNNLIKTTVAEPTEESAPCGVTSVKGVVQTVTTRVSEKETTTQTYYEYLNGNIDNLVPSKFRSGYGFTYEINGNYKNEWDPSYKGVFTAATAKYPFADQGLQTTQTLDQAEYTGVTAKYLPKNMYLSQYTGHVFDTQKPTKSTLWDGQEKIIDGKRKWYAPMKQKDGVYTFNVETKPSGVNQMSLCMSKQVEVQGVAYDDFVRRSVLPDDPFPAGEPGWNWKGKEKIITDTIDWFYMKNGK